jgi:hypothetical protein
MAASTRRSWDNSHPTGNGLALDTGATRTSALGIVSPRIDGTNTNEALGRRLP